MTVGFGIRKSNRIHSRIINRTSSRMLHFVLFLVWGRCGWFNQLDLTYCSLDLFWNKKCTHLHPFNSIATLALLLYVQRLHCTTVTVILIYLFSYVNTVIAAHENFKYSTWRFWIFHMQSNRVDLYYLKAIPYQSLPHGPLELVYKGSTHFYYYHYTDSIPIPRIYTLECMLL
jgi:hypothetical protein